MATTYPAFTVEFAPGVDASAVPADPADWVDITSRVDSDWSVKWGRWGDEFSESGAGTGSISIDNSDGEFDPDNTGGTYYGQLVAGTWFRIKGGTTSANTDVFYGHVSDDGFRLEASQFADSYVRVDLVDDLEQLSNTELPESVWALEVEADSPIAWYRLGESSGTVATDSSGNGLHGTYQGGATFDSRGGLVVGSSDNAVYFDGADNAVDLPAGAAADVGGPLSVEAWFQVEDGLVIADTMYLYQSALAVRERVSVYMTTAGHVGFSAQEAGGTSYGLSTSAALNDGAVHHVLGTYDGSSEANLYVDGVHIGSDSGGPAQVPPAAVHLAAIGVSADDAVFFDGVVDEVAVYDTELSAARALAHYEAGSAPWQGDTTGERVGKLLDAVGYDGTLRNIDTGGSTMQAVTLGGRDALSAIREAAKAEAGFVYIDHRDAGKLRFVERSTRWTATASLTSQATFGDDGSEVTYDAINPQNTRVINRATMQRANGAAVTVSDAVSEAARRRTFGETGLLYETDAESQYRAERIVAEKADEQRSSKTITLRPRKSTHSAWAHVFARSVDDRVTEKWRPAYGSGPYTYTNWVDGIQHKWSARNGLETTFSLSPVPFGTTGAPYWIWGTSTWETGTSIARWSY